MLLVLDLGFSALVVLLACAVFPLIGLVLRRKWRRGAARKEEIRRLIILASEETARAELEASAGYGYSYVNAHADGYGAVSAAQNNRCAVCYSPSTTRCAKCKAARYCSGKCQIIHWRQGHKDECYVPPVKSDFYSKRSKHEKDFSCGSDLDDENGLQSKSALLNGETKTVDSNEASKVKHSNLEVELNAGNSSDSSKTGFTGFSSPVGYESSDDASMSDIISSNDSGRSDGHISDGAAHDKSRSSSTAEDVTISPKLSSSVDSFHSCSGSSELNHHDPACYADKTLGTVIILSHSGNGSMRDDSFAEPSTKSSIFWEGTSDPVETTFNPRHASSQLDPNGNRCIDLSDSSLNCSADSSGSNIRGHASLHDSVPNNKINGESSSKRVDLCDASRFPSLKAERTRNMMSGCTSGLETETLRSLEDGSSISLRANVFSGSQEDTLSSESTHNASAGACEGSGRHLDSIVRSGKADEVNAAAEAAYSEVAGLSMNTRSATKTSVEKSVDQLKESILSRRYSLRGGSDIGGRYSGKGLFPYELFVKLYTWKEFELHPCGLINCGNSCYANAVLQCLAFTPPLTGYFLQGLHSKICAKKDWCLMCEFESLILKAKEGESPISPFRIVSRVENIGSQLSNGREEDAHEFLRYAIDEMGSVCLMESQLSSGSPEEDTSLTGLTFGGYLRSKIRCTKCQGKSEQHERMMDLTVEVEGDVGTLEEALQRFTVSETLDGENKYQCSRCGSYEKARKKLTILEAPNVLTIALKRFQSEKCGKLNKFIGYPEILNLAPYMSGTSDKSPVYRLYGVIVHLDVVNASYSGHYICYVKNPQNKWFKIDDSIVTPVDMETVLKVGAYMLLYSRCSPRAPRSLRNQLVFSDPKPKLLPSRVMSKVPILNSEKSVDPSHDDLNSKWVSLDRLASIESFYSKFHMLQRMLEEDSPSDCSSLFSNNSDESSSSSDGTRDSTCTPDDFSEYLFGGRSSPWRNSSELDSSSSSLPSSSSSSSPMASSDSRVRGLPEASKPQVDAMANDSFLHYGASGSSLLYSDSSIGSGKYSNGRGTRRE